MLFRSNSMVVEGLLSVEVLQKDGVDDPNWRPISGLLFPPQRLRLWQGPWPILSTLRPTLNEPVEPTSSDELLDLVSELNVFLCIMAVVSMVEAELVRIALPGMCAYPFWPWELLPDSISTWVFDALRGA